MCEHESHPSVSCELSSSPPTSSAGCWRGQRGSRALQPPPFSHITLCLPSKQALVYGTIVVLQTYKLALLGALFLTPGKSHRVFPRARKAATRPSTAGATSRGALPISCFSCLQQSPLHSSRTPLSASDHPQLHDPVPEHTALQASPEHKNHAWASQLLGFVG